MIIGSKVQYITIFQEEDIERSVDTFIPHEPGDNCVVKTCLAPERILRDQG